MALAYHTELYLFVFLPLVVLVYHFSSQKMRRAVLILAGYIFFWSFSQWLVGYLIAVSGLVYGAGRWMEQLKETGKTRSKGLPSKERSAVKKQYKAKEKRVLIAGIVILLGILAYLKYCNFFIQNINRIFAASGSGFHLNPQNLLIPIGISFYTLEAIGYMADVYWGRIKAEHNFGKVALFLGFFPQIMEGPISSWNDTADALWECRPVRSENLTKGIIRIAWGLFKKIVVADRLSVLVAAIYDDYTSYHGVMIVVVAIAYTLQLYMEFSGTMDVVIGSAELFGIVLPENFKRPFFSKSISEFWTRWHITLGTWFRDYIFYPISMSKPMKRLTSKARKKIGNHFGPLIAGSIALFVVWLFNGLWHGAGWHYICFGMYHFVLIASANAVEPYTKKLLEKLHIGREEGGYKCFRIVRTALLVCIGELIFRAGSLRIAMRMLKKMFTDFNFRSFTDGTLLNLGMDKYDFLIVAVSVLIVLVISIANERGICIRQKLAEKKVVVRWAVVYGLILFCIIFGAYGMNYTPVDPIYAGF